MIFFKISVKAVEGVMSVFHHTLFTPPCTHMEGFLWGLSSSQETQQSQCESVGRRPLGPHLYINISIEREDRCRLRLFSSYLGFLVFVLTPLGPRTYLDHRLVRLQQKENQCPNKGVCVCV